MTNNSNMLHKIMCFAMIVALAAAACSSPVSVEDMPEENNASVETNEATESVETNEAPKENPAMQALQFPSADGITIFANLYENANSEAPVILLCHQAGFNKAAYNETAPKLVDMGYTCMAIDQRSGGPVNDGENETKAEAEKAGKPTTYLDTEQDIVAAINYLQQKYDQNIILWGSSYSASLALKIGHENEHVSAIASWSPGEYFGDALSLQQSITGLKKPVFITSSKKEANDKLDALISVIESENLVHFVPEGAGDHGARVLWESQADNAEYWTAITAFLQSL